MRGLRWIAVGAASIAPIYIFLDVVAPIVADWAKSVKRGSFGFGVWRGVFN